MEVIEKSRIDLDIITTDCDSKGYLLTNGTNRFIYCGVLFKNTVVLVIHTNGYDEILCEEGVYEMAELMADLPDKDISIGINRLRNAVEQMRNIYSTETAQEDIDWIEEQIDMIDENKKG